MKNATQFHVRPARPEEAGLFYGLHGKRLRDKNGVRPAAPHGAALPGADAGAEDDVSKSGSIQMDQAA